MRILSINDSLAVTTTYFCFAWEKMFLTLLLFPTFHSLVGQASENQSLEEAGGYSPWLADFHGLGWCWWWSGWECPGVCTIIWVVGGWGGCRSGSCLGRVKYAMCFTSCAVIYVVKHCPNLAGPFAVYTAQGSPVRTFSWVRWWGIGLSKVMRGVDQVISSVIHVKSPGSGGCGSGFCCMWFDGARGPEGDLLGIYVNECLLHFFSRITALNFWQECGGNMPKVDPPVPVEISKEACFMLFDFCISATCLFITGV